MSTRKKIKFILTGTGILFITTIQVTLSATNTKSQLTLDNIEGLTQEEFDILKEKCCKTGGFCFISGVDFAGISMSAD